MSDCSRILVPFLLRFKETLRFYQTFDGKKKILRRKVKVLQLLLGKVELSSFENP